MDMEEKNIPDGQNEPVSEPAPAPIPEEPVVSQEVPTPAPEAPVQPVAQAAPQEAPRPTKFCTHCGGKIDEKAVICPLCGCQVEQMAQQNPNIVINNTNSNVNTQTAVVGGVPRPPRNKWVALLLCFFLGFLGVHKFYEGKAGMGVLYLLTGGLCGVGALVDFIVLLFKPNPYYV